MDPTRCFYGKGETNHWSNMIRIPVENHEICREKLHQ
jgi:hypothetical protein